MKTMKKTISIQVIALLVMLLGFLEREKHKFVRPTTVIIVI